MFIFQIKILYKNMGLSYKKQCIVKEEDVSNVFGLWSLTKSQCLGRAPSHVSATRSHLRLSDNNSALSSPKHLIQMHEVPLSV